MARQNDEFNELLGRVPLDKVELLIFYKKYLLTKVSKESVCKSTLLQDFARAGTTFAVTALLQYGSLSHI